MADSPLVLDSWAVLAFLGGEPKGKDVLDLMARANDGGVPLLMCVVNAGEVWYTVARKVSPDAADEDIDGLVRLGTQFVDVGWDLTKLAAGFKSRYRMSYADAYAAALASQRDAALVTGDPEFKPLARELRIKFL
ncbi:MAG: PIN domain-containing protein [Deltaproteobacteria bacterium]|nr:PIN domain-containing protein [Deltaproteobacteria bacterium]